MDQNPSARTARTPPQPARSHGPHAATARTCT